jgi:hypothetical protein
MSELRRLLEAREHTRRALENDWLRLDWAMSEFGFLVAPHTQPETPRRVRWWKRFRRFR